MHWKQIYYHAATLASFCGRKGATADSKVAAACFHILSRAAEKKNEFLSCVQTYDANMLESVFTSVLMLKTLILVPVLSHQAHWHNYFKRL